MLNLKKGISLIGALCSIAIAADLPSISVTKGWNLLGTGSSQLNLPTLQALNAKNISTVWWWDAKNKKWIVWSPDENLNKIIEKYITKGVIESKEIVPPFAGFWIYAKKAFNLNFENLNNQTLANTNSSTPQTTTEENLKSGMHKVPFYTKNGNYTGVNLIWSLNDIEQFMKNLKNFEFVMFDHDGKWLALYNCEGYYNQTGTSYTYTCNLQNEKTDGSYNPEEEFSDTLTAVKCSDGICLKSTVDNYTYPATLVLPFEKYPYKVLVVDIEDENADGVIIPNKVVEDYSESIDLSSVIIQVGHMVLYKPEDEKLNCINNVCSLNFYPKMGFNIYDTTAKSFYVKYKESSDILTPETIYVLNVNYKVDKLFDIFNGFSFENPNETFKTYFLSPNVALGIWYNGENIDDIDLFLVTADNFTKIMKVPNNIIKQQNGTY